MMAFSRDNCLVDGRLSLALLHSKLLDIFTRLTSHPPRVELRDIVSVGELPFDEILEEHAETEMAVEVCVGVMRCMRNAVVVFPGIAGHLCTPGVFLQKISRVLLVARRSDNPQLLRCLVQILANFLVCDSSLGLDLWNMLSGELTYLLQHTDLKVNNCTCMIVYHLMKNNHVLDQITSMREFAELIARRLVQLIERDCEFAVLATEQLCRTHLVSVLLAASIEQSYTVRDSVMTCVEQDARFLTQQSVADLATKFTELATPYLDHPEVVSVKRASCHQDQLHLTRLRQITELLAVMAARTESCLHSLALSTLHTCCRLLTVFHEASKLEDSQFTVVKLTSPLARTIDHQPPHQPTYGFKSQLTRLLVNLVGDRGGEMKDGEGGDVGRMQLIATPVLGVLMECCCLDARQPLLQQWSVLALRCLCMNCPHNQSVISQLQMTQLTPQAASQLAQLGISADCVDGKIKLTRDHSPHTTSSN